MRDSPEGRAALLAATYRGPTGLAVRQLPYRRAALSFMEWEERRGILNGPDHAEPGSPWWRAVNDRLLCDGLEAIARLDGRGGHEPSESVRRWLTFAGDPTAAHWWRAHNSSVVGSYLEQRELAADESPAERFFMNVVLLRVLYAHALIGNPRFALGWFAPLGRLLGDPRLGMSGVFLSLGRVLPDRYPLEEQDIAPYLADEHVVGRLLDYAVIAPRLQELYEWSAQALAEPGLLELIDRGRPVYGWPTERGDVWTAGHQSWPARVLGGALRPR